VKSKELIFATLGEVVVILVVAAIGFSSHMPLLFPSLGPTAYELVEKPNSPSAKLYNVVVGHLIALAAGFVALWLLNAWNAPKVAQAGFVSSVRMWAVVIAVAGTTFFTLLLKASQPAALATAMVVSLGAMQTRRDADAIVIGILILAAVGEPIRRLRAKAGVGQ